MNAQVKSVMFSEMETSLRELQAKWSDERKESEEISVEMKHWFGDVTLNMLLKVIIGKRCVGPNAMEGDEKDAKDLQMAIRDSLHLMGEGLLRDYVPLFAKLGFDGQVKAMEKIAKQIDVILQRWLQQHNRNKSADTFHKKDGDFMDSLLSLCHAKELPNCYDYDTIIKATTLVLSSFIVCEFDS